MSVVAIRRPFCPMYERNKIFASDFVYFVAREYMTNWVPRNRFIDPQSPLTADIKDGARAILRNRNHIFVERYASIAPSGVFAHVGMFYEHAMETFRVFFARCGTPDDFFYLMVYVARLAILFYQRGVRQAPDRAVLLIAEVLSHYMRLVGSRVLLLFQVIGRDLARRP